MNDQLYDKVHAVIVNWLIELVRGKPESGKYEPEEIEVYPEYPYNYYGQRGSVDLMAYFSKIERRDRSGPDTRNALELFEVWTAVTRLEEAIRKFNEKASVVPKAFQTTRKPLPVIGVQRNYFVLLNTMQNTLLIKDYWQIFQAQFFEFHKVLYKGQWFVTNQLVLVDPLDPRLVWYEALNADGSEGLGLLNRPWRVANEPDALRFYNSDPNSNELTPFDMFSDWAYLDAKDFWTQWQDSKGKSHG